MSVIRSFQISVPEEKLGRLKEKLEMADLPIDNDASWSRGPPVSVIERLRRTWLQDYDWRSIEARLNVLPQFIVQVAIDGYESLEVHCIHKQSGGPKPIPLLFLHGWPGSFLEVTKMLDDLVHGNGEDEPMFHVVAPSLIDFGFSSASPVSHVYLPSGHSLIICAKKEFQLEQHAEAYHKLMLALGYEQYGKQTSIGLVGKSLIVFDSNPSRRRWRFGRSLHDHKVWANYCSSPPY